jgi:MFS family permease
MYQKLKPTIVSALVLGCSMFGDTFLYASLPANAAALHVPVVWTGFLLSINRFVRLFFNQLFAVLFDRYGFKKITIAAASLSVLSTFFYGVASGIVIWIAARIIWAMSYAALRISSVSYSLNAPKQGFGLGVSRGLQETGPLIGLALGSVFMQWMHPQTVFLFLAIASLSSVILALYLPALKTEKNNSSFQFNFIPSIFNLLVFISALIFEGMLVVLLGRLLSGNNVSVMELTVLCAAYLALRRIFIILISPLAGFISDKLGIEKVFLSSVLLSIVALLLIYFQFIQAGIIIAFAASSVTAALAPGAALSDKTNQLKEVAANVTWRDLGAAMGALTGGWLISIRSLDIVFLIATFVLLAAFITHSLKASVHLQKIISWK